MTRPKLVRELAAQARAVALAAIDEPLVAQQAVLEAGSRTLANAARRVAERASALEEPVLELAATATPAVVSAARTRRAVRRGQDVFLPSWSDYAVGLPNALLRSSLWVAGEQSDEWMDSVEIAAMGQDVRVLYSGKQLTQYDRRVLSACLDHYKADRPLSPGGAAPWICLSFYQFAQSLGLAYTLNSHKALRASLVRLEAAALRVCTGVLELPVPRLLEVAFADGYRVLPVEELKGSDQIAFRVLEPIAALYGPATWSAVPKLALGYKGLQAWLTGFYATHSGPRQLPFKTLQALSGITCRPNDFRARVQQILTQLAEQGVPNEVRVARYAVSEDQKSITVWLHRWC